MAPYPLVVGRTLALAALLGATATIVRSQTVQNPPQEDRPRFRSGVELINVNATVTDADGRFVRGLRQEDFRVYQDGQLQEITHFASERVPVSLGILLDTSSSMDDAKMAAAREALNRFLLELLGPDDEVFLFRFDSSPELVHGWTTDKRRVSEALERIVPAGSTAMYDALAEAVPLVQAGRHQKKALVLISDGNDTISRMLLADLKAQIRTTEILVYAIGIDEQVITDPVRPQSWRREEDGDTLFAQGRGRPRPFPFPRPGRLPPRLPVPRNPPPRFPAPPPPDTPPIGGVPRNAGGRQRNDDRVNAAILREITDASGGRTEIVRSARDLNPATASIADELSRQYYLGYASTVLRDGRWHAIRVEVVRGGYTVRSRSGFVAAAQ
jgi:VWFA-related protein